MRMALELIKKVRERWETCVRNEGAQVVFKEQNFTVVFLAFLLTFFTTGCHGGTPNDKQQQKLY